MKKIIFILLLFSIYSFNCTEQSITDQSVNVPSSLVLTNDNYLNFQQVWHPLGEKLVYVSGVKKSNNNESIIWGTTLREITIAQKQITDILFDSSGICHPDYHPQGNQLVYASRRTGSADIWLYDFSLNQSTQLTKDNGQEYFPRWSPNGQQIAFIKDGKLCLWELLSDQEEVTFPSSFEITSLCWESASSLIVTGVQNDNSYLYRYSINEFSFEKLDNKTIKGENPVYKNSRQSGMLAFERNNSITAYSYLDRVEYKLISGGISPSWSPDGTWLACSVNGTIICEPVWVGINE